VPNIPLHIICCNVINIVFLIFPLSIPEMRDDATFYIAQIIRDYFMVSVITVIWRVLSNNIKPPNHG
jgi:hypothetical protein